MENRKDYVDYLTLELNKFEKWYTKDSDGFGNNKNMLQVFEGVLTALTMINFNDLDRWPIVLFDKHIGEQYAFIGLSDCSDLPFDNFPNIKLVFYHDFRNRFDEKPIVMIYKIGFDQDFQDHIKPKCENQGEIINEYPTWRSAFNQLVKDYHELEKNAHKRIHKGVSIHET